MIEGNGLTKDQINCLFEAKNKDLSIKMVATLYSKFCRFLKANCKERKFKLESAQLEKEAARVIASVMATNPNFSRYLLKLNSIRDEGVIMMAE